MGGSVSVRLVLALCGFLLTATTATASAPILFSEPIQAAPYLNDVAAGDLEGDGGDDLVFATGFGGSQLSRSSSGTVTPSVTLATDKLSSTYTAAIGDWDGDGDRDVFLHGGYNTNRFFTSAAGSLSSPLFEWGVPGGSLSFAARVARFDANNCDDVAVLSADGKLTLVLHGPGGSRCLRYYDIGGRPTDLLAEDLNEDGVDDLVVPDGWDKSQVLLSDGAGGLIAHASGLGVFEEAALSDFDGDGHVDAVVARDSYMNPSYPLDVLRGDGTGSFTLWKQLSTGNNWEGVKTGDFNEDGLCGHLRLQSALDHCLPWTRR